MAAVRSQASTLLVGFPLLFIWCLLFALIPLGEQDFPFNDDWAYGRTLFTFLETGKLNYYGWPAMPLLGQLAWGAPFAILLGNSFGALKVSTLTLAALGLVAFQNLLESRGISRTRAFFGTLALTAHPYYFVLAGTFMNDVPALSFSLIALAAFARGVEQQNTFWWNIGCASALLGVLSRQNTIAVPIAALSTLMLFPPGRRGSRALGPLLVIGAGLAIHLAHQIRSDTVATAPRFPDILEAVGTAWRALHAAGLAALPILLLASRARRSTMLAAVIALALFVPFFQTAGVVFLWPFHGPVISPYGSLAGPAQILGERPIVFDQPLRIVVTVLGVLAGSSLVSRISRNRAAMAGPASRLLATYTVVHLLLLITIPADYDRYNLVFFPAAIFFALTSAPAPPVRRAIAGVVITGYAIFSFVLAHDWISWNRARWELGARALEAGIDAERIEGGFEWNGYHTPWQVYVAPSAETTPHDLTLSTTRILHPHVTGEYGISFSPRAGADVIDREPFRLFLRPGLQTMYLLKAQPERTTD